MFLFREKNSRPALSSYPVVILVAAYGGVAHIDRVEVPMDDGETWRQWRYVWEAGDKGSFTVMSRRLDAEGNQQPMNAEWNVLGYGNNGVTEHAVTVRMT